MAFEHYQNNQNDLCILQSTAGKAEHHDTIFIHCTEINLRLLGFCSHISLVMSFPARVSTVATSECNHGIDFSVHMAVC